MALMYCRECGKQVSSEAPACPHCGVPHPVYMAPPPQQQPQSRHAQGYPQQPAQPEYVQPPLQQSEHPQPYVQQPEYPQVYVQQQPAELQPQPVYLVNPPSRHDPTVAALLSFFMPGVGQMYKGEVGVGIAFLIGTIVGYLSCVVPGLVLHIFSIINAARRD